MTGASDIEDRAAYGAGYEDGRSDGFFWGLLVMGASVAFLVCLYAVAAWVLANP